jgi:hypothetical protein
MSLLTVYWDKDFKVKTLTPVTQSANGKSATIGLEPAGQSGDTQNFRFPPNTKAIIISHGTTSNETLRLSVLFSSSTTTVENSVVWSPGQWMLHIPQGERAEIPTEGQNWLSIRNLTANGSSVARFSILYLTA